MRPVVARMFAAACGRLDFDGRASAANNSDAAMPGDGNGSCSVLYPICDGFEGSTVYRGLQSLHVHTGAIAIDDGDNEGGAETATFGGAATTLFVRAFVRFAAIPGPATASSSTRSSSTHPTRRCCSRRSTHGRASCSRSRARAIAPASSCSPAITA